MGAFLNWHGGPGPAVPVQVVGVVADLRQAALAVEPWAEVLMDYRQVIAVQERWGARPAAVDALAFGFMSFALRTRGEPADAISAVRRAIPQADPEAAIDAIDPVDRLVANSVARQRFYTVILAGFAAIAAVLAAIGIYGVLAYVVVERTREIVGLAVATTLTRYLQSMLYGVTPLDRGTFLAVALAFSAVAALASYLPARRATRVDPMVTLRTD